MPSARSTPPVSYTSPRTCVSTMSTRAIRREGTAIRRLGRADQRPLVPAHVPAAAELRADAGERPDEGEAAADVQACRSLVRLRDPRYGQLERRRLEPGQQLVV